MMGEAEGGNRRWRLRLLRHELGHAVDTAFGLRRRGDWRQVFGTASALYSRDYTARPRSRSHVLHLEHWYAQSHPTEDFAETFAVWLRPKGLWRAEYAGWPALAKLEFVDRLMTELAGRVPAKRDRSLIEPLTDNHRTLGEHYRRRVHLSESGEQRYDSWLLRVFPPHHALGHSFGRGLVDRSEAPADARAAAPLASSSLCGVPGAARRAAAHAAPRSQVQRPKARSRTAGNTAARTHTCGLPASQ